MKRVMVDQGCYVEVLYPDLYKGLNLKPEDLTTYDLPLAGFDGKLVALRAKLGYLCKPAQKWWKWTS